jgi:uroporphyrin-3 C-methyltransferase
LLLAFIAVAAAGAAVWQAYAMRQETAALRVELAQRLTQGESIAVEARAIARQQQEMLMATQGRLAALEARVESSAGQAAALETLYQQFSHAEEDRVVAEVEYAVMIAAQQLQLAGNVETALIALQGAQARLALQDRGQLAALRRALASDIDHLRQRSTPDIPATALRLEQLLARVDALPLAFADKLPPRPREPDRPGGSGVMDFASGLAREMWHDMLSLVRIERMDSPVESVLLSPGEGRFLRENLKIRLLTSRLALLARDGRTYAADLTQARNWIERFFNTRDPAVQAAIEELRLLEQLPVRIDQQDLALSFNALKFFQARTREHETPAPPDASLSLPDASPAPLPALPDDAVPQP